MKAGIHPQYNESITVTCSCGNSFLTGSIKESIRVDLCSKCHPFYTGTQKLVDTEGKVEKFARKRKIAQKQQAVIQAKKQVEQKKQQLQRPNSLAEMVAAIRKQQKAS